MRVHTTRGTSSPAAAHRPLPQPYPSPTIAPIPGSKAIGTQPSLHTTSKFSRLSWQITPVALTVGMKDPDPAAAKRVFDAMMKMRKIDVAAIRRSF